MGYEKDRQMAIDDERRERRARRGSLPKRPKAGSFGVGFVNIHLPPAYLAELEATPFDAHRFEELITDLVSDGYKIGFTNDARNHCIICSVTGSKDCSNSGNSGLCITGRGRDCFVALLVVAAKHFEVAAGSAWVDVEADTSALG